MARVRTGSYKEPEIEKVGLSLEIRMTLIEFLLLTAQSSPSNSVGTPALGRLNPKGIDDGFLMVDYQINTSQESIDSLVESLQHLKKSLAIAASLRDKQRSEIAKAFEKKFLEEGAE